MAYTGKKPGDVSLSTLYESGGALQNHDDVTVDASGNVGIGTTSPAEKLEIYNGAFKLTGSNGAGVRMTHGNTENGGEINLLDTNGAVKGLIDYVDADDDGEGTMRFLNLSSTTGEMEIGTNGANVRFRVGGSEKLRILPTGGITFNGDTAAANALDDYEEGTWDATLTASAGGTITLAPTASAVCYSKIGNRVFVSGRVNISAVSSPSGTIRIQLPYVVADTADNSNQGAAMVATHGINLDAGIVQLYGEFSESNSYINLFQVRDGASWTPVPASNLVANGGEWISFSGSYVTT